LSKNSFGQPLKRFKRKAGHLSRERTRPDSRGGTFSYSKPRLLGRGILTDIVEYKRINTVINL